MNLIFDMNFNMDIITNILHVSLYVFIVPDHVSLNHLGSQILEKRMNQIIGNWAIVVHNFTDDEQKNQY